MNFLLGILAFDHAKSSFIIQSFFLVVNNIVTEAQIIKEPLPNIMLMLLEAMVVLIKI